MLLGTLGASALRKVLVITLSYFILVIVSTPREESCTPLHSPHSRSLKVTHLSSRRRRGLLNSDSCHGDSPREVSFYSLWKKIAPKVAGWALYSYSVHVC